VLLKLKAARKIASSVSIMLARSAVRTGLRMRHASRTNSKAEPRSVDRIEQAKAALLKMIEHVAAFEAQMLQVLSDSRQIKPGLRVQATFQTSVWIISRSESLSSSHLKAARFFAGSRSSTPVEQMSAVHYRGHHDRQQFGVHP
jgi:hypothetical protein